MKEIHNIIIPKEIFKGIPKNVPKEPVNSTSMTPAKSGFFKNWFSSPSNLENKLKELNTKNEILTKENDKIKKQNMQKDDLEHGLKATKTQINNLETKVKELTKENNKVNKKR